MKAVDILYEALERIQKEMNKMDRRYTAYRDLQAVWHNVYQIYHAEFQKEVARKKEII